MISVVAYNEQWPHEFLEIARRIRSALPDRTMSLHHIGSTSVPGLAAKNKIDIQLTVPDLKISLQESLEKIGFELAPHQRDHCPPGLQLPSSELEKRLYRGTHPSVNLHVRKEGAFNQRYPILFRDFLRANSMAAAAYGEIKLQLAKYFPENEEAYYDIKDPVCDALMAGAFIWAQTEKWAPGPSEA